jgi:hypothetical protein
MENDIIQQFSSDEKRNEYLLKQVLDTEEMLLQVFLKGLHEQGVEPVETLEPAASARPGVLADMAPPASTPSSDRDISNYERAILALGEVRDDLAEKYAMLRHQPGLASLWQSCIGKLESAIRRLGGEIEPFDPLLCASGLETKAQISPDLLLKNARRVAENTLAHYRLFPVQEAEAVEHAGRPAVRLGIAGQDERGGFQVRLQVTAKEDFDGNEAIDYVRSEGRELISVKAEVLGQWRDVSERFEFHVNHQDANGRACRTDRMA